jgi:hypothetical protein
MSMVIRHRWGLGFGTATLGAILVLVLLLANTSKIQASAADVMTKGAAALNGITSIHLRGQVRTPPNDNFSAIDSTSDFVWVELKYSVSAITSLRLSRPSTVTASSHTKSR